MLCDQNWTFYSVFGLNWPQFVPENYQKTKKAIQRPGKAKAK